MSQYLHLPTTELLDQLASTTPGPAAGSAAALTGAAAAALVEMVATLTMEKAIAGSARLQARYGPYAPRAEELAVAAGKLRQELQALVQEDAELVAAALAPQPGALTSVNAVIRSASEALARRSQPGDPPPQRISRQALEVAEYASELLEHGYRSAAADAATALGLALAAAESANAATAANLERLRNDPDWVKPQAAECAEALRRISMLRARLNAAISQTLSAAQSPVEER